MKCSRCGRQADDNDRFCGYCGNELKQQNAKGAPKARWWIWIPLAVVLAAGAAGIVFGIRWNSSRARLERALEKEDYETAVEIWNSGSGDSGWEDGADMLRAELLKIYDRYASGQEDGGTALEEIGVFKELQDSGMADLAAAAEMLVSGDEDMQNGQYQNALENYRGALACDPELEQAAWGLEEAENACRDAAIGNAEACMQNEDYEGALEEIRSALLVLENDETLAAKEEEINACYQEYKKQSSIAAVEFQREYTEDYREYAVITGKNGQGDVVWSLSTGKYIATELDAVSEIGIRENVYYYVEGGTLVALNLEDGTTLWENSDFMGFSPSWAFGENGEIYLCGYYGPDFFAVDEGGNTLAKIQQFNEAYYWASGIRCEDGQAAVTMSGSPDGKEIEIRVDLSDYSYTLPAASEISDRGKEMSLEQICRAVEEHYNQENNTDIYVVFEEECSETDLGFQLILRSQGGSSANELVGIVEVRTDTGMVRDEWGGEWPLY